MQLRLFHCISAFAVMCFLMPNAWSQGFSEISASLGLNYGYFSGEYGGGVSFVDFNQDGLDDLTMPTGQGQTIRFHVNTGTGFTEIAPLVDNISEVKQVLWVDYDNDGDMDLYVTSHDMNMLYKNTGDLTFVDITASAGFSDPFSQSFNAAWLDYDEDGLLDVIVSHRHAHLVGDLTLYHNLGGDLFEDVTFDSGLGGLGNSVLAMTTLDYNNDGLEDIYVGQDYDAGNILLENNGDGTFNNISVSSMTDVDNDSMSTTVGDYDGDGLMDIYVTNTSPGNSLFRNLGDGSFSDEAISMSVVLYSFTWGAVFLDADGDTDLDLYVNGISGSPSVFMFENPGDGSAFINSTFDWGMGGDDNYSVGNAIGDYNGDGRPDIMKNGSSGELGSFWQNDFTENNYLTIDLEGIISNVNAIGAVVDIDIAGEHQIRRLACGEGFSSQNSLSQFFGLGTAAVVDNVTVTWPNGLTTNLTDVAANQRITIYEVICNDPTACNYDPEATTDDDCIYPGCNDMTACNYDPLTGCDDGSCEYTCQGCTDPEALNYDPNAEIDDGSCLYPCTDLTFSLSTDCWGFEISWELVNDETAEVVTSVPTNTLGNQETSTWTSCLDEGCYTFTINDTYGDGLAGSETGCDVDGSYLMQLNENNEVVFTMDEPNFGFGTSHSFCLPLITGCMDDLACNYDPEATTEDGSCTFPGCTDPFAATYDPLAGCDDGSCLYAQSDCLGDLNNDSQVSVADLLILLTVFGTLCD